MENKDIVLSELQQLLLERKGFVRFMSGIINMNLPKKLLL